MPSVEVGNELEGEEDEDDGEEGFDEWVEARFGSDGWGRGGDPAHGGAEEGDDAIGDEG